jgi:hypothetical protein
MYNDKRKKEAPLSPEGKPGESLFGSQKHFLAKLLAK